MILSGERCWYYCFICDSSLSAQLGKPSSIAKEDFIIRNGKNWYKQRGSIKSDVGLSAMVEMHRIVVSGYSTRQEGMAVLTILRCLVSNARHSVL